MAGKERYEIDWSECVDERPADGVVVHTACGGITTYSKDTPCLNVNGEQVFFCLPICKQDFLTDPRYSCLANKLELNRKSG